MAGSCRRTHRGPVVPVRGDSAESAVQERRRAPRGQERASLRGREAKHGAGEQRQGEVHHLPGTARERHARQEPPREQGLRRMRGGLAGRHARALYRRRGAEASARESLAPRRPGVSTTDGGRPVGQPPSWQWCQRDVPLDRRLRASCAPVAITKSSEPRPMMMPDELMKPAAMTATMAMATHGTVRHPRMRGRRPRTRATTTTTVSTNDSHGRGVAESMIPTSAATTAMIAAHPSPVRATRFSCAVPNSRCTASFVMSISLAHPK
jgi:hypothetical protein